VGIWEFVCCSLFVASPAAALAKVGSGFVALPTIALAKGQL